MDPADLTRAVAQAQADEQQGADLLMRFAPMVDAMCERDDMDPADIDKLGRLVLAIHERLAAREKNLTARADAMRSRAEMAALTQRAFGQAKAR